jgi:hypothetical protein
VAPIQTLLLRRVPPLARALRAAHYGGHRAASASRECVGRVEAAAAAAARVRAQRVRRREGEGWELDARGGQAQGHGGWG